MARKTAVRVTRSAAIAEREGIENVAAAELAADDRKDRAAANPRIIRGLLPSLAEMRATRGIMPERDLLERARSAARLELRGASYSTEDRADVAAKIMGEIIERGEYPGLSTSPRLSLTRCCGLAANYRRSIDAQRERDQLETDAANARRAHSADALGIDTETPARHAEIVARSTMANAKLTASALCRMLGVPDAPNSAHWTVLYQWSRGETAATCAAELAVGVKGWESRLLRGAKFLRGFFSADQLADALTLGASYQRDGSIRLVMEDRSTKAPHKMSKDLAEHFQRSTCWRERTDIAPIDITTRKLSAAERAHWTKQRARRAERTQETADSLQRLGRALAYAPRRERAVSADSALTGATRGARTRIGGSLQWHTTKSRRPSSPDALSQD